MIYKEVAAQPIVRIDGARVLTNSRDVAAYFQKRHDNVLDVIDKLVAAKPELGRLNFKDTSYLDGSNRHSRCIDMDRDGFTVLAMRFTGEEALTWQLAYIQAFNAMEAEIKSGVSNSVTTYDEMIGVVREITAPLAVRFDTQDTRIHRVEIKVDQVGEDVRFVKNHILKGRRTVTLTTKRIHISDITALGGRCPCCGEVDVIVDGGVSPWAECDHFFENSRPNPDATWFICKKCHNDFTFGRVPRDARLAEFQSYQAKRRRLPDRQPSFWGA